MAGARHTFGEGAAAQNPYFLGLDVIRLWAAMSVTFFHLGFFYLASQPPLMADAVEAAAILPWAGMWWRSGWVGVEVFFVLSGVVIFASAEGKTWWLFLKGRLLRLYPTVWICASLSVAAALASGLKGGDNRLELYARSLALTPFGPWIDGSYWTLPIEMSFYALMAALLRLRAERYLLDVVGWLGVVSASYWILGALARSVSTSGPFAHGLAYILTVTMDWRSLDLTLIHHGCFFALGALVYCAFVKKAVGAWAAAAAPVLICGCLIEIGAVNAWRGYETGVEVPAGAPSAAFVAALVLMVASTICRARIARACGPVVARCVRFGGLLTYPLYLCHLSLGFAAVKGLTGLGAPPRAAWTGGVALTILAAALVAAWGEPWLRRGLASRAASKAQALAA